MSRRLLLMLAALASLMAVPSLASATMAYTGTSKNPNGANLPIIVSNNDGTNAHTLGLQPVTGWEPVISPNARYIAVTSLLGAASGWSEELHFVSVGTGQVIDTNTTCSNPVWAPNSSAVACLTPQYSSGGKLLGTVIRTMTPSAFSTPTRVWVGTGYMINGISWSPDSTKIAWGQQLIRGRNPIPLLRWRSALGTGGIKKLGAGAYPVWGPTKIAYVRLKNVSVRGQAWQYQTVYTTSPNSIRTVKKLSTYKARGLVNGPRPLYWLPNGSGVVGNLMGEDYSRPMLINATTGKLKVFGPTNAAVAAVSANSQSALVYGNFLGGGQQTAIVTTFGKSQSYVPVLTNAGYVSVSASWNP